MKLLITQFLWICELTISKNKMMRWTNSIAVEGKNKDESRAEAVATIQYTMAWWNTWRKIENDDYMAKQRYRVREPVSWGELMTCWYEVLKWNSVSRLQGPSLWMTNVTFVEKQFYVRQGVIFKPRADVFGLYVNIIQLSDYNNIVTCLPELLS